MIATILNYKVLFCLILMTVLSYACSNTNSNEQILFGEEHWLIGDWIYMSGEDTVIEQWMYLTEMELACVNQKLKNGDSLPNETVSLRLVDESYVFEVKVEDQNNGEGVPFALKSRTENKLVFENKEHDFPQQIVYELINNDSCVASIIGTINKQERKIDFSLVRLPD